MLRDHRSALISAGGRSLQGAFDVLSLEVNVIAEGIGVMMSVGKSPLMVKWTIG